MSERDRLQERLDGFKAEGRMPQNFRIPRFLLGMMTEGVAANVNRILDKHLADEAAMTGTPDIAAKE